MEIFIGDLSVHTVKEDVKKAFEAFGKVGRIHLRKRSGGDNPRCFGTVDMPDDKGAQDAIKALNGQEFHGRLMTVMAARPKEEKPKKDWKEIKRLKKEAKSDATIPIILNENVPELKEVKVPKVRRVDAPFSGRKGPSPWKKRIGRVAAKPCKKKPGGIKKTFKDDRL